MMNKSLPIFVLTSLIIGAMAPTAGAQGNEHDPMAVLYTLAGQAVDGGPQAEEAIKQLRAVGPRGIEALQFIYTARSIRALAEMRAMPTEGLSDAEHRRIQAVIDKVAGQKDGAFSGLYWYTDINQALAAAEDSGKPILTLRMLGNLDSELSCANSRYFRTALYANRTIASHLREHYVLHWESVRPVPVVKIDFGDGREVRRTITGNSIHYILDSQGRVINALPGMVSPQVFLRQLERYDTETVADINKLDQAGYAAYLKDFVKRETTAADEQLQKDLNNTGLGPHWINPAPAKREGMDPADAQLITSSKRVLEMPMVRAMEPIPTRLAETADETIWRAIAALPRHRVSFDLSSIMLMTSKLTPDQAKTQTRYTEDQLAAMDFAEGYPLPDVLHAFSETVAVDTVINMHDLRLRVLSKLVQPDDPTLRLDAKPSVVLGQTAAMQNTLRLNAINAEVYEEIFLMPADDPWLGLADPGVFTGLPDGGVRTSP